MRSWTKIAALFAAAPSLFSLVQAQTTSKCNPRFTKGCPDDPALSGSYDYTFGGEAPQFSVDQSADMIEYKSDGAHFIVAKTGDAPTITSDFYIMYGKLNAVIKAAPGHGIVSSLIMLSDALDEVDWEWIGSDTGRAQSNYFGKGDTSSYDRAAYHAVAHQEFHDYGIEWTPQTVKWTIDGAVVRTLTPDQVKGDLYPQTPMQIKIGPWSGGDPENNNEGTIEWSQGPTDYTQGPFHMVVKSIKVQDYSTGQFYHYNDDSGSASSISSKGGQVMVGPGVGDGKGDGKGDGSSTTGPTTFRAPSNTGRTPSSTSTSTKFSSAPGRHTEDSNADTTSETTPTPTGSTTGSSSGFTTSTRTTDDDTGKATSTGTSTATRTANGTTTTNQPVQTHDSSTGNIQIQISGLAAAIAVGLVGVGLVL